MIRLIKFRGQNNAFREQSNVGDCAMAGQIQDVLDGGRAEIFVNSISEQFPSPCGDEFVFEWDGQSVPSQGFSDRSFSDDDVGRAVCVEYACDGASEPRPTLVRDGACPRTGCPDIPPLPSEITEACEQRIEEAVDRVSTVGNLSDSFADCSNLSEVLEDARAALEKRLKRLSPQRVCQLSQRELIDAADEEWRAILERVRVKGGECGMSEDMLKQEALDNTAITGTIFAELEAGNWAVVVEAVPKAGPSCSSRLAFRIDAQSGDVVHVTGLGGEPPGVGTPTATPSVDEQTARQIALDHTKVGRAKVFTSENSFGVPADKIRVQVFITHTLGEVSGNGEAFIAHVFDKTSLELINTECA